MLLLESDGKIEGMIEAVLFMYMMMMVNEEEDISAVVEAVKCQESQSHAMIPNTETPWSDVKRYLYKWAKRLRMSS